MVSVPVPAACEFHSAVFVVFGAFTAFPAVEPVAVIGYLACLSVLLSLAVKSVVLEFSCIYQRLACVIVFPLRDVVVALSVFPAEAAELSALPFAVVFYLEAVDEDPVTFGQPRSPYMTLIQTCAEVIAFKADIVSDTVADLEKIQHSHNIISLSLLSGCERT